MSKSIRQIMLQGLVQGLSKDQIKAQLVEAGHGEAQAVQKFPIHYAWYKGWLKKYPAEAQKVRGEAPPAEFTVPTLALEHLPEAVN